MTGAEHDRFLRRMAPLLEVAWRKYRRRQSRRGLQSRLAARGVGPAAYAEILASEAEERERLLLAMRVTVSRFYRDPQVWNGLARTVLPSLLGRLGEDEPLRVWSAGCASGEEAYSVAVLWARLPSSLTDGRSLEVLGTDVDAAALGRARAGVYLRSSIRQLPPNHEDVFEVVSVHPDHRDRVRVSKALREIVQFAHHDLLSDPPPAGRHLVLCRYLPFTYYEGGRLLRAVEALAGALVEGGALVVGAKESVPEAVMGGVFDPWPDVPCVYRKIAAALR